MSSILKAIRKVEEEKRAVSHSAPDLRSDQGANVHVKKSLGPLLTGMMLGAVCVGLFLYAVSVQEGVAPVAVEAPAEHVVASSPEPTSIKPVIETIPVVTLPPEPVAVKSVLPVKKPAEAPAKTIVQKQPPVNAPKTERPVAFTAKKRAEKASPAIATETSKPAVAFSQVKPLTLPGHINLNVAEIFYQEDPTNSMAVVNDLPVMPGTAVEGALVKEIRPDHVVFRVDGKDYSVYPVK